MLRTKESVKKGKKKPDEKGDQQGGGGGSKEWMNDWMNEWMNEHDQDGKRVGEAKRGAQVFFDSLNVNVLSKSKTPKMI